jgi:hypothetical protein
MKGDRWGRSFSDTIKLPKKERPQCPTAVHRRIQESAWRKPKKERIYNWLRLIAQTGPLAGSSDCFLQGAYLNDEHQTWVQGSKRTLADYIEGCRNEGINLITIPESYGIDWLPNPMRAIVS